MEMGTECHGLNCVPLQNVYVEACHRLFRMLQHKTPTGRLISNRNLYLAVRSQCHQQIPCVVRGHFLVHRQQLLTVSSHGGRDEGALWVPFIRALIPSWGPTLVTQPPPKGPTSLMPSHGRGVRIQHTNFGGMQTFIQQSPNPQGDCIWG